MDSGKKEALRNVKWQPAKNCGTCRFGSFEPGQYWGLCENRSNDYIHKKHNREHKLPANRMAVCTEWVSGDVYSELKTFLNSPITS